MSELKTLNIAFTRRVAPLRGPRSSDMINDSFEELSNDLVNLSQEWNNKLSPMINTLPRGLKDTAVNAFTAFDGANIWLDSTITASSVDQTFWNAAKERPSTIKEAVVDARAYIDAQVASVREDLEDNTLGLTTDQKAAIGDNIFDNTLLSSSSSLDGKSENNRLNNNQIAEDVYGAGYSLDNDGAGNLAYTLKDQVGALLLLHNGSWNTDIDVDHAVSTDLEVTDSSKGLILKSPDGTRWRITVDNSGVLSTTSL